MKRTIIYLFVVTYCFIISCKKTDNIKPVSAFNIINAAPNVSRIVINFTESAIPFYQNQTYVYYGSNLEYSLPAGKTPIVIVSSFDTAKPILQGNLNLFPGSIYSMYIIGLSTKPDTLLIEDHIVNYATATSGIRFSNLSPDSQPISINLQGNPSTQTEFNNLSYKQISSFKTYDASVQYGSYTFEIRDQASGNLLTTFDWYYSGGKNNTIVISGSVDPNSSTPINVFQVNNY